MVEKKPGGAMYDDFRSFFEMMERKHGVMVSRVDAGWMDVSSHSEPMHMLTSLEIIGRTDAYTGNE
jgi:hypothetical protein